MEDLSTILDSYGTRSRGDDLLGFLIDLEYYLNEAETIASAKVRKTGDPKCMLLASCGIRPGISVHEAKSEITQIWNQFLRYEDFHRYKINGQNSGFSFHFLTYAPGLGVIGRIDCMSQTAESGR